MTAAMVALGNLTLSSSQATVTFSSIPGTYRDLRLVISGPGTAGGSVTQLIRFNGDSGNASTVRMYGDGSTAASGTDTLMLIGNIYASVLFSTTVDIMDYSATDKHKNVLARNSMGAAITIADASRWASTAAITSVTVLPNSGNSYAAGCTFALFGVVS